MKLPRSISETELKERLRLADLKTLKSITRSFIRTALINLNENISANNLRKAIESIYFRKRELMPKEALKEPIKETYSFDSLISCSLTERQNNFELYRYLYDHITPGEPVPRKKLYEIAKKFCEYKDQEFSKRNIYSLVRNTKIQQEDMENKVIISTNDAVTFNRIYTWKNNHPVLRNKNE